MNGFQNRNGCNIGQKRSPGCMGRMVNLFYFSTGIPTSRLLMEKEHQDGAPLPRSRLDLADKVLDPIGDQIEDSSISQESSNYKKSNRSPMKMLIAREKSKEMESNRNPPSVIARLMGLDALPAQQPVLREQRSLPEAYSQTTSRVKPRYQMPCEIHPAQYKDVYQVSQQSSNKYSKGRSVQKEGYVENPDEKKMALVRQKFIEAKRLATDEKLRQSKEFQEALEVLSANKDLFLKFLQEPNSLFLNHCYELYSIPPPPHTKRITILKPSKTVEEIKKHQVVETNGLDKNKSSWSSHQKPDSSTHPTRIVVLKPSPGKTNNMKIHEMKSKDYYGDSGPDGTKGSREIAKEITQLMRESFCSNKREENLLSSILLNKYVGDESSFIEEGKLSDSEIMTPTTGHSWDYINRMDSPLSSSSFSGASYPPESSVIREAKKRLSERWATMKSNGSVQEQRQVRRSTSTLGEMLSVGSGGDGRLSVLSSRSCGGVQDFGGPNDSLTSSGNKDDGGGEDSPRDLLKSRSVPVSSLAYEKVGMDIKVLEPDVDESIVVPEKGMKSKPGTSSLKGKVSSLFFSRNKKLNKDKSGLSSSVGYRDPEVMQLAIGKKSDDSTQYVTDDHDKGGRFVNSVGSPISILVGRKDGAFSAEALLPVVKSRLPKSITEVQDQPSPVSVLEVEFEDEANDIARKPSGNANSHGRGKSNPLSWVETASQEKERFMFVQKLLSTAGLDQEKSDSEFSWWHSPESPLDPLLRDKVVDQKLDKDQRLLFDCVSAALADVIRLGTGANPWTMKACGRIHMMVPALLTEEVWSRVREWFSSDTKWLSSQSDKSVLVERVVREEVDGRGWVEMMGLVVDGIGMEIEGAVMEQLLEEALAELTCVL